MAIGAHHHISQTRPLILGFRFIIYLPKHVPSCGDRGSSHILNTPLMICLKHAPLFGDSGSSWISFAKPAPSFSRAAACGPRPGRPAARLKGCLGARFVVGRPTLPRVPDKSQRQEKHGAHTLPKTTTTVLPHSPIKQGRWRESKKSWNQNVGNR